MPWSNYFHLMWYVWWYFFSIIGNVCGTELKTFKRQIGQLLKHGNGLIQNIMKPVWTINTLLSLLPNSTMLHVWFRNGKNDGFLQRWDVFGTDHLIFLKGIPGISRSQEYLNAYSCLMIKYLNTHCICIFHSRCRPDYYFFLQKSGSEICF